MNPYFYSLTTILLIECGERAFDRRRGYLALAMQANFIANEENQ
jgi:hypothetical protein